MEKLGATITIEGGRVTITYEDGYVVRLDVAPDSVVLRRFLGLDEADLGICLSFLRGRVGAYSLLDWWDRIPLGVYAPRQSFSPILTCGNGKSCSDCKNAPIYI